MMPNYGSVSQARLESCAPDLRKVFNVVIDYMDNTILCGHRSEEAQNKAFRTGRSKVQWPNGKHNTEPSEAVDAAPWPINWKDRERMTYFAGMVVMTAQLLFAEGHIEHLIRWGGDWDKDTEVADNGFDDLVHFELYKPET
jgi:peptidoglycan LD-endopeptidase CwlK